MIFCDNFDDDNKDYEWRREDGGEIELWVGFKYRWDGLVWDIWFEIERFDDVFVVSWFCFSGDEGFDLYI